MTLEYTPLLQVQRNLHDLPRGQGRFKEYLRTIFQHDELGMRLPLLAANPMGKDHVTKLLDSYLALSADAIGAAAAADAATQVSDVPGNFKVALIIADDLMGGWTNRYAQEFEYRIGSGRGPTAPGQDATLPRWLDHFWLFGVLWSSEPASERAAREAILTTIYRAAYIHRHGLPRTLRDMLTQEGHVMAQAGCTTPALDDDDLAYTREVLTPFLDEDNKRACMECLFGDEPGKTLGFTPRGLSPWAGLALALHDGRARLTASVEA